MVKYLNRSYRMTATPPTSTLPGRLYRIDVKLFLWTLGTSKFPLYPGCTCKDVITHTLRSDFIIEAHQKP